MIALQRHRPRRRGSIVARGNGLWLVRVTLATDPVSGRQFRQSKVIRGKKTDAEKYLTDLLARIDGGEATVANATKRQTLGEWLAEYFATWSVNLAPRTRERYQEYVRLYLPEHLLATKLASLSARALQDHFTALAERVSWTTASFVFRLLRARLNDAVTHGRLTTNPMTRVQLPPKPHTEHRTLTPAQARVFLAAAESDRFGTLWSLLLLTGLRPGEALGLKWQDLDGSSLHVRRSVVRTENGAKWSFEDTKTDRARRVALPEKAVKVLSDQRRRQVAERLVAGSLYTDFGLIFATRYGAPLNLNTEVPRHFKKILKAANLPSIRLYDLRHTAATLLLAAGEHPRIVQDRLGHASVTLTLDTYSHVQPDMQQRAADRLEELLSDAPAKAAVQ